VSEGSFTINFNIISLSICSPHRPTVAKHKHFVLLELGEWSAWIRFQFLFVLKRSRNVTCLSVGMYGMSTYLSLLIPPNSRRLLYPRLFQKHGWQNAAI